MSQLIKLAKNAHKNPSEIFLCKLVKLNGIFHKKKDCNSVAPVEFSKWALHRFRYDKHISMNSHNYPKNHSLVGILVKCWRTYVRSLSVICPGNFLGELNSESKAENNPIASQ